MKKFLTAPLLIAALAVASHAQQANTEFKITKITPDFATTPEYSISLGPKSKKLPKNKEFLEVEVAFDWQPRANDPKFLDELTINYFILLNNKDRQNPQGALLVGSVTHTAVPQATALHSVMYVSPRTLERFFEGKVPTTINNAIKDVGITITQQGRLVADASWKGKGQWWATMQQIPGYVLNKNESPFAPLFWDYYEAIKAR